MVLLIQKKIIQVATLPLVGFWVVVIRVIRVFWDLVLYAFRMPILKICSFTSFLPSIHKIQARFWMPCNSLCYCEKILVNKVQ